MTGTWFLAGILAPIALLLTGAGGGIVVNPVIQHWGGGAFSEAVQASLLAVFVGASFHWVRNRKLIPLQVPLWTALGAFLGNIAWNLLPWQTPEYLGRVVFIIVTFLALVSTWIPPKVLQHSRQSISNLTLLITGWVIGTISMLTGLGGGLFMVPIFNLYLRRTRNESVVWSAACTGPLAAIGFLSNYYQKSTEATQVWTSNESSLLIGVLLSSIFAPILFEKIAAHSLANIRLWAYRSLVMISLIAQL